MKRFLKIFFMFLAVVLLVAGLATAWAYWKLRDSLPAIEGELQVPGLTDSVRVERDALGVPAVRGKNRADVALALGFLHGQDRFFQMDLMRRQAAGELSELIGEAVLEADRSSRVHRFRSRAKRVVESILPEHRKLLNAYVQGVNAGLAELGTPPFEYLVLGSDPCPWLAEDTVLALLAMFFVLNDEKGSRDSDIGLLHDLLPQQLAEFLAPPGTSWDAPIAGGPLDENPIPGPEVWNLRDTPSTGALPDGRASVRFANLSASGTSCGVEDPLSLSKERGDRVFYGSNNWAVAGTRTGDGRAILADDMHLGISVPNTWYRALLNWQEDGKEHTVVGVTLPGTPVVVAGSNTEVAWGFTNTGGDWVDLVVLEVDEENPDRYRTPGGYRTFETYKEEIRVKDAATQVLEVRETIWGPVIDEDHKGRPRALRWIAHDHEAINLKHFGLEHVTTVSEAVEIANKGGIPPQNFVTVDNTGRIGWTVEGAIPRRFGFSGRFPVSWADGSKGWNGWLQPEEYPRILEPEDGLIWTANARVVEGEMLRIMGDGGYALGARAKQIRDGLRELREAEERDMLAIQLDDRALLMERWRDLLLKLLKDDVVAQNPGRADFRRLVKTGWTGRASTDSVGFRLVRAFRTFTFEKVYGWLTLPCSQADSRFSPYSALQWEGPLWQMVTEQPVHLLEPRYDSWDEALLAVVDATIEYYNQGVDLEKRTWGERNTSRIQHPLSRALPMLSGWLDMPDRQLPGDALMPRVQGPGHGASERFAVAPGRESEGYFHMPGGQSGHPLSLYYRAGHDAWVEGRPAPFLPGPAEAVLVLTK